MLLALCQVCFSRTGMIFQSYSCDYFFFFCLIKATVGLLHKRTYSLSVNCSARLICDILTTALFTSFFFLFFSNLCSAISQWLLRKHLPPLCYVMSGQELKLVTDNLNNGAFVCVSYISATLPYVFPQSTELGAWLVPYLWWAGQALNFS